MSEQIPFDAVEFVDNPEPRCPCLLLLDTSASMSGAPIGELSSGLEAYFDELTADELARKRVEVALITFGGAVSVAQDFATPGESLLPALEASGMTPMGAALREGLDLLDRRKSDYRAAGISLYRPWVFLITDGAPTDSWRDVVDRIREGEEKGSFMFFAVGTADADFDTLAELSVREPLRLKGLRFRDLFAWLSSSQKSVSRSTPGDAIKLEPATGPDGWGEIPT